MRGVLHYKVINMTHTGTDMGNIVSIVGMTRPNFYEGIEKNLSLYLEKDELNTVTDALDTLKEHAPPFYRNIEKYVQNIKRTESEESYRAKNNVYLSIDEIAKGKVHCIMVLVHEAKHIELNDVDLAHDEEQYLCFEEEKKCLEMLGDEYSVEVDEGLGVEAYGGLSKLGWLIYKANNKPADQ